jgi:hypothetical protein
MLGESLGLELNQVGGMVGVTLGESAGDWLGGCVLCASGAGGPGVLTPNPREGLSEVALDGAAPLLAPPFPAFSPLSLPVVFPPSALPLDFPPLSPPLKLPLDFPPFSFPLAFPPWPLDGEGAGTAVDGALVVPLPFSPWLLSLPFPPLPLEGAGVEIKLGFGPILGKSLGLGVNQVGVMVGGTIRAVLG